MNMTEVKIKLLDLKNSQLVRSNITYTICHKSIAYLSIHYVADQKKYEMVYLRDHKKKSFANIEKICEAIKKEIHKNVRESKP
ncbi:hypothetical protein [Fictibacillus enclensis]|uniref:hypothetical protein n=1 Tax=Fictibacillus enclensis TaxID=1017270 RepID=UPI0024C09713|nr:hypothetical protein [Fictibacillus enclensis]WHY73822.1 hypothetical protein QNH15_07920 [Fictibacillus enclensis]